MCRSLLQKLGENVRAFRHSQGISQEELAGRSGLHRTYVGSVERGERNISLLNLAKLAKALGIPLETLIKNIEE